jgi:hypothetical protein
MQTKNLWKLVCGAAILASVAASCGGDEGTAQEWEVREAPGDETGYGDAEVVVIAPGGTGQSTTYEVNGDGSGCVQVNADTCVDVAGARGRYCGDADAQADIILNADGEVIDVICYPSPAGGTPIKDVVVETDGGVELPQNANGAVLVFDEATDGVPIEGNVDLESERVVVFGNGVDKTIFAGNLHLASNNARVRGVTVQGNLEVAKNSNNNTVSFCKILGNVSAEGNGFTMANCQVFGNLDIKGNGATLLNIGVAGEWKPGSAACDGCYSFEDANDDDLVQDTELGDPLECASAPMP